MVGQQADVTRIVVETRPHGAIRFRFGVTVVVQGSAQVPRVDEAGTEAIARAEFTAQVKTGLRHVDGRAIGRQPLGGGRVRVFRRARNAIESFVATDRYSDESLFAKPRGAECRAACLAGAVG